MALGEQNDFRSKGFQQVNRFPGQDHIGGTGSPMLQQWTQPSGSTNMSLPVSPLTVPGLNFPGITFPGITLPNQLPPVSVSGIGGGGTATGAVKVYGPAGSSTPAPTDATEILFQGTALNDVTVVSGVATVTYDSSGGSGSTLKYGKITAVAQPSGSVAYWNYTVQLYTAGTGGSSVSANNLLELNNNSTTAYGYAITSGNRLTTTPASSFYLGPVPTGTMVQMENTADPTGSSQYWFSAPNPITGGC